MLFCALITKAFTCARCTRKENPANCSCYGFHSCPGLEKTRVLRGLGQPAPPLPRMRRWILILKITRSNSVFVVQSSALEGLTAVATCEATLEAIPQSPSCIPLLEAVLPLYPEPESTKRGDLYETRSKQSVLTDTPVSSHEFNQAWTSLCAFEVEGQAYRPTPHMLWKAWKSLLSASTIEGCSLDQPLNFEYLASTVEDDEMPIPLLHAVINRVSTNEGVIEPRRK